MAILLGSEVFPRDLLVGGTNFNPLGLPSLSSPSSIIVMLLHISKGTTNGLNSFPAMTCALCHCNRGGGKLMQFCSISFVQIVYD